MQKKRYAIHYEYGGSFIGTLEEATDWMANEGIAFANCEFYELGKKVKVGLEEQELAD